MAITVHCPSCSARYQAREESLGSSARCKKCGATFTVAIALDETAVSKPAADASGSKPQPADIQPAEKSASKRIGKYLIKRKLGAGGMGEVWLGHDPDLERDVAIKILPAMTQDQDALKRFLREARLAAKLHHTNTVAVYEVGVDGKRVFIAMELVNGQSLDKTVDTRGRFSWREATEAIRDAATGLSAAHELGLVHRDIKPANLMRTAKNVTKVVDFGLARAQAGESRLTQEKMVLGTPAYMAPEQWAGGEVDARTDLYSLTCTYYHLLTGKPPYDAPSFVALGYQHRHEPFPDPRRLAAELPDAVCRILVQGSQKLPDDRFQTAVEFRAALDSLLSTPDQRTTAKLSWAQLSQLATVPLGSTSNAWLSKASNSKPIQQLRKHPLVATGVGSAILILCITAVIFATRSSSTPRRVFAARNPGSSASPIQQQRPAVDNQRIERPREPSPGPFSEAPAPSTAPPPGPFSPDPNASISTEGSDRLLTRGQFDDANLEVLDEVKPQFTPIAAAESAKIEAARTTTLAELKSDAYDLRQIMSAIWQPATSGSPITRRGPDGKPLASQNLKLPDRFLLTGTLGAVRVQGRSTWVFLWIPTRPGSPIPGVSASAYPSSMGGGPPLLPVAAIEFAGVDLTLPIADFRVGEEVCVVVKRKPVDWANDPASTNMRNMMGQAWPYIREYRQFTDGGAYWTFDGEAMEKPLRPETWVDAKLGRAARLTNEVEVMRSPGQMMRSLPRFDGTKGILVAQFQSVSQSASDGKTAVQLLVPTSCEGGITVSAEMGAGVSARDFLGFHVGDTMLAAVRLNAADSKGLHGPMDTLAGYIQSGHIAQASSRFGLPPGMTPSFTAGGVDPLTAWRGFSVDCARINKENDPTSLVASGVHRQATVTTLTPKEADANLEGSAGLDVVWIGELWTVRQLGGDTHFSINGTGETPGTFDAFCSDADFIDQVADFVSSDENQRKGDVVRVTGKLVAGDTTKEHLAVGAPLVQMTEIARVDRARSTAKSGQTRGVESLDPSRKLSEQYALWRKPPLVGPRDAKNATGVTVTWAGKLKTIYQLDGRTHFIVNGEQSTPGDFEAFTSSADFLAQVSDYIAEDENSSMEDTVIVSGEIVARDDAQTRKSRRDLPLLQLTEIRRANHPESLAAPGQRRAAGKFDGRQKLSELDELLRNLPEVGTEVTFTASYRVFFDSSKFAQVSATADSSKQFKITLPNASKQEFSGLRRGDAVVITAVITKSDRSDSFSPVEFEGKSMVPASEKTGSSAKKSPK